MAGAGDGSCDRQEECVLQEVADSGCEKAGNATGGGGVVGGYQPGSKVGFGEINVESRGYAARRVWEGDGAAVGISDVGSCPIGPTGGVEDVLESGEE